MEALIQVPEAAFAACAALLLVALEAPLLLVGDGLADPEEEERRARDRVDRMKSGASAKPLRCVRPQLVGGDLIGRSP
jgi:hypothetical protein